MIKITQSVIVIRSQVRAQNSLSRKSCDAIIKVLSEYYTDVQCKIINTKHDLEELVRLRPDVVFVGLKYVNLEKQSGLGMAHKLWVADFLEQHNIPYTGSNTVAHTLELNKHFAKAAVLKAGLNTAAFRVVRKNSTLDAYDVQLTFPLFVKPTDRGGGEGIDSASIVHTHNELHHKVLAIATTLNSDSLVEEYLPGKEYSVAILKNQVDGGYDVMPIELVALPDSNGDRMLSSIIKKANEETVHFVSNEATHRQVSDLAMNVFTAIGGRDYGRIDIRSDESGKTYFLEANLIPSLIEGYGSFPKACELNLQMSHTDMLLHIVRLASARTKPTPQEII